MRRREVIAGIGATAAWAFHARAQQPVPTAGFVNAQPAAASQRALAAFRKGLGETGCVEGRNVTVEYHWLDNQFDRLPALMAGASSRGRYRHAQQHPRHDRGKSRHSNDPNPDRSP